MKKVLIACEFSGIVREAFRKLGHDAWSCDLLDTEIPSKYHIKGDVLNILDDGWDLMIAHPPCTYLCNSGVSRLYSRKTNSFDKDRYKLMLEGCNFFNQLKNAPIEKICIENPIPHSYARELIGKYTQIIQPWMFGEDASKATCLWLKNLPKLIPTNIIKKDRYANQTPSGQNNLGPSKDRWKLRSMTYQGIANALAEQYGKD